MRVTVLIIAVLGGIACAALGYKWYSDYQQLKPLVDVTRQVNDPETQAKLADLDRTVTSAYLLMVALPLGILGGVMAMQGNGKVAALILIVAGVAPVVFQIKALLTASLLFLAALLSLLIRPVPPTAAAPVGPRA